MNNPELILEILNGPLDGHSISIDKEIYLSKEGEGDLIFPWNNELGTPQTRIFTEAGNWFVEGFDAPHGTYFYNREKRIEEKVQVNTGDILKASEVWLSVVKL